MLGAAAASPGRRWCEALVQCRPAKGTPGHPLEPSTARRTSTHLLPGPGCAHTAPQPPQGPRPVAGASSEHSFRLVRGSGWLEDCLPSPPTPPGQPGRDGELGWGFALGPGLGGPPCAEEGSARWALAPSATLGLRRSLKARVCVPGLSTAEDSIGGHHQPYSRSTDHPGAAPSGRPAVGK